MGAALEPVDTPFRIVEPGDPIPFASPGDGPTPTRSRDDAETHLAARDLLAGAVCGRAEFVAAVATLSPEAWPTQDYATIAHCVCSLADDARAVDPLSIFEEAQRLGLADAAHVAVAAEELATYAAGTVIRAEYIPERVAAITAAAAKAQAREKLHKIGLLAADPDLDLDGAREYVADLGLFDGLAERDDLHLVNVARWREAAEEPLNFVFDIGGLAGTFGVLAAEGGTGKSTLGLQLALSITLNQRLALATPRKRGPVLYLSGEDPAQITFRRIDAIAREFQIPEGEINWIMRDGLFRLIDVAAPLLVFTRDGGAQKTDTFHNIRRLCVKERFAFVLLDSVVHWGGLQNENDAMQVQRLAEVLIDLARASGGFLLAIHHVNKASAGRTSQAAVRGSGGFMNASRFGLGMCTFSPETCDSADIDETEAHNYLQVEGVKNSYAPRAAGGMMYLRRTEGGAFRDFDFQRTKDQLLAELLRDAIVATGAKCTSRELTKASGTDGKRVWDHIRAERPDLKKTALTRGLNTALEVGLVRLQTINPKRSEICAV